MVSKVASESAAISWQLANKMVFLRPGVDFGLTLGKADLRVNH
jgi:hypothetical protein